MDLWVDDDNRTGAPASHRLQGRRHSGRGPYTPCGRHCGRRRRHGRSARNWSACTPADLPVSVFIDVIAAARERIDVLMYATVYLHEAYSRLNDLLRERAEAGGTILIALGDADSLNVQHRGSEDQFGHGIESRCQLALMHDQQFWGPSGPHRVLRRPRSPNPQQPRRGRIGSRHRRPGPHPALRPGRPTHAPHPAPTAPTLPRNRPTPYLG